MIRLLLFMLVTLLSTATRCQIARDSLVGTYVFESWKGGGFRSGPNGECMVYPPDYSIKNILTIGLDMMVTRISDTTQHSGILKISMSPCFDTLYIGKARLAGDTLVVTYTMRPVCHGFYLPAGSRKKTKQYEKLEHPAVEKYIVWVTDGKFTGLMRWQDGWEEYYKESDTQTD